MKYVKLTEEELEKERIEAERAGISIFQLRHIKKLRKAYKEKKRKEREEEKKEKQKLINIEKGKEKRKKTMEKKRIKREKLKALEKEKKKKEKERIKKAKQPKKKRPGRHKKRGVKVNYYKRKKRLMELEKKKMLPRKYVTWDYKLIACRNGKQIKYINKFQKPEDAYEAVKELLDVEIIFPARVTNSDILKNTKYEYLILEHKKEGENSLLRNEFGKLVEQTTNSEKWGVLDKFSYEVEETFWVWGYNNVSERKTFKWIYDNILVGGIRNTYDIIRVGLYKNKIVFMHDDDSLDIIFCKTMEDSIRFYNKIEEFLKKDKIKQIFMVGSFNQLGEKRKKLELKIAEMTGWKMKKIQMTSTTEHGKK